MKLEFRRGACNASRTWVQYMNQPQQSRRRSQPFSPTRLAAFPASAMLERHSRLLLPKQRPSGLILDWTFLLPALKSLGI
jgi:hypothetical protein